MNWTGKDRFHMDFGTAMHAAAEVLTAHIHHGYTDKVVAAAIRAFEEKWDQLGIEDMPGMPKSRGNGRDAILMYADEYPADKNRYECLYTEIAGTVPLAEDRFMRFRLDALLLDKSTNSLTIIDHKTVSRLDKSWQEKWDRAVQVQTYLLVLHYLAPLLDLQPGHVVINGWHLLKPLKDGTPKNGFIRIPLGAGEDAILMSLYNLNHWWDQMQWNYEILTKEIEELEDRDVLNAFPVNGEACSRYPCRTGGLCTAWLNPLTRINDRPPHLMERPPFRDDRVKWQINLGEDTELRPVTEPTEDEDGENSA